MAGLYCDITLLASVGRETATNTISRQAILYSSSGLMFSAQTVSEMDLHYIVVVLFNQTNGDVTFMLPLVTIARKKSAFCFLTACFFISSSTQELSA